jgi:hypothetical protein
VGKPYATELASLAGTYSWSLSFPVTPLVDWVKVSAALPLVAVGSGGSLITAHLGCFLHETYTGRLTRAVTPLELSASPLCFSRLGLLLVTAGGSNPDILSSYLHAREHEPGSLAIACARTGSPLGDWARESHEVSLLEFDLPTGKDGFLATNSLLATSVLLARAYACVWPNTPPLPPTLAALAHPGQEEEEFLALLAKRCRPLWERETLVVLHGKAGSAAAIDLETRFTEAALGRVQVADFRNFAHGRHHWLARNEASTAVLALVSTADEALAERTLRLLPEAVPVRTVHLPADGFPGTVAGVVVGMHIAGLAGKARGIDPGRPKVPEFGRRLYHLRLPTPAETPENLPPAEAAAIERKSGLTVSNLRTRGELNSWLQAYSSFTASLCTAQFRAAVFDYDGTLCGASDRYSGLRAAVVGHLVRLLRGGVAVGIATGRGKSVRKDLRIAIADTALWDKLLVGYHNGGEIAALSDESVPPEGPLDAALAPLEAPLRGHPRLVGRVAVEAKLRQVTVEFGAGAAPDEAWAAVEQVVRASATQVTMVRSSHSIDVLAPGVSKAALVERLSREAAGEDILCVGDRGRWPGNDHQLLAGRFGLSVDEVSPDPSACWNLAPPGARGVEAALYYLERLVVRGGVATINLLGRTGTDS